MAKGQKGVSVVMCVKRVIGNLMDSANGFHAPKPDLDVKQENNNPRNNKVSCSNPFLSYMYMDEIPVRISFSLYIYIYIIRIYDRIIYISTI